MSDVVSLTGSEIVSCRRTQFLEALGQAFDRYVQEYGEEPDSVVFNLGGVDSAQQLGWQTSGRSYGLTVTVLALTAAHAQAEIAKRLT
jgi:hypothetical protein